MTKTDQLLLKIQHLESTIEIKNEAVKTKQFLIEILEDNFRVALERARALEKENKELILFRNINYN